MNISLLSKLAWRLLNNPNDLWVRLLKGKYFPRKHPFHKLKYYNPSWIWTSITKGLELIKNNSIWEISNGRNVYIAKDNWIPNQGILNNWQNDQLNVVSDLMDNEGHWNNDLIDSVFSREVATKIKGIYINFENQDRLRWLGTKEGMKI